MESSTVGRDTERPPAIDAKTVCEAFQITADAVADQVALRTKDDEVSLTWADYADHVRKVAAGLASLGVKRGDTVAIMLTNRPEFHYVDAGAMHLGATPFSIYNTYTAEQIEYLVGDAGNTVAITEQAFLDRILAAKDADNALEHVVVVDGDPPEGTISLEELESRGEDDFDFEATWKAVEPDDILTLIYTSGTTGPPKGVQITHGNMVGCVRSYDQIIGFPFGGRIVSYLPMAHVAERNVSQYLPMLCGFSVTDCPDPRQVAQYLPEVRPSWFFAVPRIWEKMKAGLEAMLAGLPEGEQKEGMQKALDVSLERVQKIQAGEEVPEELEQQWQQLDEQVLSNVRAMLGLDQVEACNVGAAPTPPEVIEFFHALGVPLAELWGMSETCGAGTCNPPEKIKIGTVGPPAPGLRDQARRGRRGADPRAGGHARLPQPARQDRRDVHRGRLPAHGRHRRVRRGRLPEDRRPQEGADHQRGRQEHVAGQHRGQGQGRRAVHRPGGDDRRRAPVQQRAGHARPRRPPRAWPRRWAPRPTRGARGQREGRRAGPEGDRRRQRAARPRGADQEVQDPAHGVGARRRRADAHDEAQAQADRREVQDEIEELYS